MLNLFDKGMENAVCCFGTNTLQNNTKQKLLPFRAQGVTHIYILFDGDDAGTKAVCGTTNAINTKAWILIIVLWVQTFNYIITTAN